MKANVYIDGFNLYYGCVRGTPHRWLNLATLCRVVFPEHQVNRIRYFTARIRPTLADPQKPQRQLTFIRALQTIPNLSVHYGHFLSHPARMALAHAPAGGPQTVEVIRTDEKGSDVNLATYLLVDGFEREYEVAVVVSNDSDLVEPIRMVQEKLHLPVGVLNPQRDPRRTSWALRNVASFYRRIRVGALQASQFPPSLEDMDGTITKPLGW